jgi:hypothetical protein
MVNLIKNWVLTKVFVDGFKHVEKQDLVTVALTNCYKIKDLKPVWGVFCMSIISLLEDAIDEVKQAKEWK